MDSLISDVETDEQFGEHFHEEFSPSIGKTVVEDKDTGQQLVMWKVAGDDESCVSKSLTDAVMGWVEKVTGGEL